MTMDLAIEPPPARRRTTLPVPAAALFDLDGTLIDSVPDITLAVAELQKSEHLPPLNEAQVRRMIGHGVRNLVRRAYNAQGIALDEDSLDQRTDAMFDIYPRHLTNRTTLMPGTLEAIDHLVANGCRIALVTNKPQSAAEIVLSHFGLMERFDLVMGDVPGQSYPKKPDPAMLIAALSRLGVAATNAIMVGDSGIDIQAGRAAGVWAVGIRGGYTDEPLETFGPDLVLEDLGRLPAAFAVA
jgi:phosphoglycolate phosphatase